MPKLIATKGYPYGGRRLKVGDAFNASRRDARVLIATKRAKADLTPPTPAGEIVTRDMEAGSYKTRVLVPEPLERTDARNEYLPSPEPDSSVPTQPETLDRPRRQYRRRDQMAGK